LLLKAEENVRQTQLGPNLDSDSVIVLYACIMERLKEEIMAHLIGRDFSSVPEQELERVWPDAITRLQAMHQFAEQNGLRLFSYTKGHAAIFTRRRDAQAGIATALNDASLP